MESKFKVGDRVRVWFYDEKLIGTIKEIKSYTWSPTVYWVELIPAGYRLPLWKDYKSSELRSV